MANITINKPIGVPVKKLAKDFGDGDVLLGPTGEVHIRTAHQLLGFHKTYISVMNLNLSDDTDLYTLAPAGTSVTVSA